MSFVSSRPSIGSTRLRLEVEAKQNSLFPGGPVILKCFVIPPSPKIEKKNAKKSFAWRRLTDICCGFKELDLITCESKVRAFVELGDITTAFITLGVKVSQVGKPKKTSQHVRTEDKNDHGCPVWGTT